MRGDLVRADPVAQASPQPSRGARWQDVVGVLISAVFVLLAYHQVAFGGRTFDPSVLVPGVNGGNPPPGVAPQQVVDHFRPDRGATPFAGAPWAEVTSHELWAGRWPLWNPYEGTGEPLAGSAQPATFDPLMVAVNLHPTQRTWDLSFLAAFMLASAAVYLFVRALGAHPLGAVAAAAVFTFSGFFAMDTSDMWIHAYAYLPILFLTVEGVARTGRLRWVAAMGVAVGGSILAGMPEATFFMLASAGAYAVFRIVREAAPARPAMALRLGGAAALGGCLGAPLLLTFGQFVPLSYSVHVGRPAGPGATTEPTAALLWWLVPQGNGYPYLQRVSALAMDRNWCGTAAAVSAVAAIAARRDWRRAGTLFFLVAAAAVLIKNHRIPGLSWVGHLPLVNRVDFTVFALPVAGFCLAVLAGLGIHALVTGSLRRSWFLAGMGVAAVLVGLLLRADAAALRLSRNAFGFRAYGLALGAGLLVAAAYLAGTTAWASPRTRRGLGAAVATVIAAELFVLFPQGIYAARANPYQPPAWLSVLDRSPAATGRLLALDAQLFPNTAGVFGIQDVRTLNALYVARYRDYIRAFVSPTFTDRFTGEGMTPQSVAANPMLDLLGVRYLVTAPPDTTRFDQLQGPGAGQFRLLGSAASVDVYENLHAAPRAFVASAVHAVGSEAAALSYLAGLGRPLPDGTTRVGLADPTQQVVVEGAVPSLPAAAAEPRPARIVSYHSQRVVIDVPAGAPGLLVLTDAYYPGWQATVNGTPAPVLPADIAFRGVVVGPGASTVVFRYRSPGGNLGWGLPLLGVLVLLGAGLARARRGSRAVPSGT